MYFHARSTGVERLHDPVDWELVRRVVPTFFVSLGLLTALMLLMYTPRLAAFWASSRRWRSPP